MHVRANDHVGPVRRYVVILAAATLSAIAVVIGLGFLSYGLYLELVPAVGQPLAALLTGFSNVVLAILAALVGSKISPGHVRRRAAGVPQDAECALPTALSELIEQGATSFKANPAIGLATTFATGVAIGASPRLRQTLLDFAARFILL